MLRLGVSVTCVILLSGYIADAQAQYKCTKDGKVTYSDKPCAEAAGKGASQQQITPAAPPGTGLDPSKPAARPNTGFDKPAGLPGDFAMFKKAIDAGNGEGAAMYKKAVRGEDAQTMQRYAETQCRSGSKVACFAAYCGNEITDRGDYYSRKCADVMGRAYGNTWMEVKAERSQRDRQGYENTYVACLEGDPASYNFAEQRVLIQCLDPGRCRHNHAPDGRTGNTMFSEYLPSLKEAAEAGCKLSGEQARRARGR